MLTFCARRKSAGVTPQAVGAEAESRKCFALGAFAAHDAKRAAAASSAPRPLHIRNSQKATLNLTHGKAYNYALASAELRSAPRHGDFVADTSVKRSWPYGLSRSPYLLRPPNGSGAQLSARIRAPRTQRTKSAACEALQRRASHARAVSCSAELGGG
jgi:hypothetical protein